MTPKKYRKFRNFWHCWYVEWEQFVSFWNNLCQRLFAAENLELDNFNALPQCPVKYDKVLGRSLSELTLSGAFRFKNSLSFKLCPWIFCGLGVFRVNVFHTSCLLYTLLLTKKCFCHFRWKLVPYAPSLQRYSTSRCSDLRQIKFEPWNFSTLRITHALCFSTKWRGYACNAACLRMLNEAPNKLTSRRVLLRFMQVFQTRCVETSHAHEQGGVDVPTMQPAAHAEFESSSCSRTLPNFPGLIPHYQFLLVWSYAHGTSSANKYAKY